MVSAAKYATHDGAKRQRHAERHVWYASPPCGCATFEKKKASCSCASGQRRLIHSGQTAPRSLQSWFYPPMPSPQFGICRIQIEKQGASQEPLCFLNQRADSVFRIASNIALYRVRIWGWLIGSGARGGSGVAHSFAIPLLPTPAVALCINDAGSRPAAAFVVLHSQFHKSIALILADTQCCDRRYGYFNDLALCEAVA